MTYEERIFLEKSNWNKMYMYSDRGLFYKLYEKSAYAFYTRIKPFKVHVKNLKALPEPYIYLGFPAKKTDEYLKDLNIDENVLGMIVAQLDEPINIQDFHSWKSQIIKERQEQSYTSNENETLLENQQIAKATEINLIDNTTVRNCIIEIKTINLASITPMEAILYLNKLQTQLKDLNL